MRTISFGDVELETAVPDDLDGRVRSLTGLSAAELRRQLVGFPIASTVAAALLPFLTSPMERSTLAGIIADFGVRPAARAVAALYADVPAADVPAPALTVESYCDRYMAGDGRDDATMLQFAVNNGEAIEAEFARRNEAALAAAAKPAGKAKKK